MINTRDLSGMRRLAAQCGLWLAMGANLACAQGFTHADSGWVPIFNGKNFDGLYSRMYDKPVSTTIDPTFQVVNGTIKVAVGGGHIGTQKKYSHYRVRVEYRFDRDAPGDNAGLTYHTDETVARMGGTSLTTGNWPRSIECQMKQSETGSAFSIQQVTFTTTVTDKKVSFAPYKFNGQEVQVCASGCDGRNYRGNPLIEGGAHWQRMEVVVRGADSARHIINDTTVLRLWNIRIFNAKDAPPGPYGSGSICLQAEGATLAYRNWEIMELRPGGPDYQSRYFLTTPNQGEHLVGQSIYKITWKTLGAMAKVNLQYSTGGAWKPIADSAANTGSFDWKVPVEATEKLRVRVSGPAWAYPDSSDEMNAIVTASRVNPGSNGNVTLRPVSFGVAGRGEVLVVTPGSRVEIEDISGRRVRGYAITGGDPAKLEWDLRDAGGAAAHPGLYFIRAAGPSGKAAGRVARVWVF